MEEIAGTKAPKHCRVCHNRQTADQVCVDCLATIEEWVDRKGSERLCLARKHNLLSTCLALYYEERLEDEYPAAVFDGWHYNHWKTDDIRHPSIEALESLSGAKKTFPEAQLRFLALRHVHRNGCGRAAHGQGLRCPAFDFKGPVLVASFHGAQIMRRLRSI